MQGSSLAIVGIGETPFPRAQPDTMASLCLDAVLAAANDAGIDAGEIDGIVTDNLHMSQIQYELIPGLRLREDTFVAHSGSSGAGTAAAPLLAALAIEHGLATNVVCVFGSKYGSAAGGPYSHHSHDPYKTSFELPYGFFPQAAYMAMMAQRYLHEYGYSIEEYASVAITTRAWASLHPEATKREPLTLEGYLESPLVAEPLRNVDCSLISDGAAAFLMTSAERARDLRRRPVLAVGCARVVEQVTEHAHLGIRENLLTLPSRLSGPNALRDAKITADDIDLLELYDCFSIVPVIQIEDMGFFERGAALAAYCKGETAPGGRLPVNTHGGLLAHSYLLGVSHICEAVKQLRGDAGDRQVPNAETALITGWAAMEHTSLILQAAR